MSWHDRNKVDKVDLLRSRYRVQLGHRLIGRNILWSRPDSWFFLATFHTARVTSLLNDTGPTKGKKGKKGPANRYPSRLLEIILKRVCKKREPSSILEVIIADGKMVDIVRGTDIGSRKPWLWTFATTKLNRKREKICIRLSPLGNTRTRQISQRFWQLSRKILQRYIAGIF